MGLHREPKCSALQQAEMLMGQRHHQVSLKSVQVLVEAGFKAGTTIKAMAASKLAVVKAVRLVVMAVELVQGH